MKTAKDVINAVMLPLKEFFGIEPKTQEQKIKNEIVKNKRIINVEERAGQLYIVYRNSAECEKHAFVALSPDLTVGQVLDMLNAARDAAVSYNTL